MKNIYKNPPFIKIFAVLIALLFVLQLFSSDFRMRILGIFRLPLRAIAGTYYVLRDIPEFQQIRRENKILRENLANLKKEILKVRELSLENKRLRKLLDFREELDRKVLPAMVIARDPSGLRDAIIIDKGSDHGIKKDMVVISGNGLVGRVREVGRTICRILLITDTDSVVSGIVARTRDEGAVEGNMRLGLNMKYLERDSGVKEGDEVITSGFSGVFEKGILIGEVTFIKRDPSGLYLNANIKPSVDMMKLEEVLVMR